MDVVPLQVTRRRAAVLILRLKNTRNSAKGTLCSVEREVWQHGTVVWSQSTNVTGMTTKHAFEQFQGVKICRVGPLVDVLQTNKTKVFMIFPQ
jgi:hypothetical protein